MSDDRNEPSVTELLASVGVTMLAVDIPEMKALLALLQNFSTDLSEERTAILIARINHQIKRLEGTTS